MMYIYIVGVVIYFIGICVYVSGEVIKDVKFHEGGFLNMGYTTCSHRNTTPKDVRMGLLWPILLTFWFIKTFIWILNDLLAPALLIFNYNYKKSKIYKFINKMSI